MSNYNVLLTCPKGLEEVLKNELLALKIENIKLTVGGVFVETGLAGIYAALIHSRVANRVLLLLYEHKISDGTDLTEQALSFDWAEHFQLHKKSLAIRFKGQNESVRNTMYGAQAIKDGINDYCTKHFNQRIRIDKKTPDILLHAYLKRAKVSVYFDIAGKSLHQRGYRLNQGDAPLKENVASGLLHLAKWMERSAENQALIDPFCGSGTFLIEAWQMATHAVPGLRFTKDLSLPWLYHDQALWQQQYEYAFIKHQKAALKYTAPIIGFDADPKIIAIAKQNIKAAGLEKRIQVSCRTIENFSKPKHLTKGLVIANPPYGERLSEVNQLLGVYHQFGRQMKLNCDGWGLAVLTTENKLAKAIGLKSHRQYKVKNGALDCLLVCFEITVDNKFNTHAVTQIDAEGQALLNRLKKNQAKLKPWLKQQDLVSYRLYDADLVEFNAAIDIYQTIEGMVYAHVQEYQAPLSIPENKIKQRLQIILDVLRIGMEIPLENIFLKQRAQQRGREQYNRVEHKQQKLVVRDGQVLCFVNLSDYLDTGLFLDHRRIRASFGKQRAKTFLNLFCYTSVASLHAAKAGAITTNVDLSKTYLNWSKDNFRLNHQTINKHHFIHADVIEWLSEQTDQFDIIFCDPPSFSNSKRMAHTLDLQRDHAAIIEKCMQRLTTMGSLYFSSNKKQFKLDQYLYEKYHIKDITAQTRSKDFDQARVNHTAFCIKYKS